MKRVTRNSSFLEPQYSALMFAFLHSAVVLAMGSEKVSFVLTMQHRCVETNIASPRDLLLFQLMIKKFFVAAINQQKVIRQLRSRNVHLADD